MPQHDAFAAVYGKHDALEAAVRKIAEEFFNHERLSVVGKDRHAGAAAIGSRPASVPHSAAGSDA